MKKEAFLYLVIVVLVAIVAFLGGVLWKNNQTKPAFTPAATQRSLPSASILSHSVDDWDPFAEMHQMQDLMNRMFRDSFNRARLAQPAGSMVSARSFYEPDLDLKETDKEYVLRLDVPGIDQEKISIKSKNGMLVISGERQIEKEEEEKDSGVYRMERSFGSFMRSFPLPENANTDEMKVENKNGVLTIRIPKRAV